jgi:hypothetical protein
VFSLVCNFNVADYDQDFLFKGSREDNYASLLDHTLADIVYRNYNELRVLIFVLTNIFVSIDLSAQDTNAINRDHYQFSFP